MELSLAVLSGFIAALIAPSLNRIARDSTGWLLAVFPSILFVQSVCARRRAVDGSKRIHSSRSLPRNLEYNREGGKASV